MHTPKLICQGRDWNNRRCKGEDSSKEGPRQEGCSQGFYEGGTCESYAQEAGSSLQFLIS